MIYLQIFCGLEEYHSLNMPSIASLWRHLYSRGVVSTVDLIVCVWAGDQHSHALREVVQFREEQKVIDQRGCHTSTHRADPVHLKTVKSFQTSFRNSIKIFAFMEGHLMVISYKQHLRVHASATLFLICCQC